MIRRSSMRRALVAALAAASLVAPIHSAAAVEADPVPLRVCRYDWQRGIWHMKQLIKCAARRWDSPGTPLKAIAVARCESGLRPGAYSNGYAGLYQQAVRYWPGRADQWGQPDRSVYNGRANIIVSIRMAASMGSWYAWGGCAYA